MKKLFAAAAAVATLTAVPAHAGTLLTTSADAAAPVGSTTVMTFDSTGSAVAQAASKGYTLTRAGVTDRSGTEGWRTTTSDGTANTTGFNFVSPNADSNGFYAVGGKTSTGVDSFAQFLGATALSSISVYIGTIDNYNQVQLLGAAGDVLDTFSGTTIFGAQTSFPGSSNLRATFTGTQGTSYYGIKFSNTGDMGSFEFDNLAMTAAVPEPATWAMMLVGFGMVAGAARYRRRSTKLSLA